MAGLGNHEVAACAACGRRPGDELEEALDELERAPGISSGLDMLEVLQARLAVLRGR